MPRVVVFGSVNVDRSLRMAEADIASLSARYEWFPAAGETVAVESVPSAAIAPFREPVTRVGGKGANQATAAAQAGSDVAFIGAVGRDVGRLPVDPRVQLAVEGVDVGWVPKRGRTTGVAYIWVRPDGENHIAIVAGANDQLDPRLAQRYALVAQRADSLLVQNEVPPEATIAMLDRLPDRSAGGPVVVFDPAPATGAGPVLRHGRVDVTVPNATEAAVLAAALESFAGTVIRTEGADGVVVNPEQGARYRIEALAVDVTDTTGAGDAFAGFLAARLGDGVRLRAAVTDAVIAGGLATTEMGARTPPADEAVRSAG